MEITHAWLEGGVEKTFRVPAGRDAYDFECGPDPRGHTIEMRVPAGHKG